MEIHRSARRHGVDDADMLWAIEHPLAERDVGDEASPRRWLVLGPDRSGRLLEVIVLVFDDHREMVIHAMAMRTKYEWMLGEEQ